MKASQLKTAIQICYTVQQSLFIWGAPGIGKSQIVKQVADHMKIGFIDIRALLLDPVDLRGVPSVKDGQTVWNPCGFLPTEGNGILFLDELNAAPPSVQAALYQLVLDRRIGEYVLPEGWAVMAAGNRETDRGVTFKMPTPLASRFAHVTLEPDLNEWRAWRMGKAADPAMPAKSKIDGEAVTTGFIGFRPGLLHNFDPNQTTEKAFPCPRTWEFVAKVLPYLPPDIEFEMISGIVGKGAATEFVAFVKIYRSLPNPDAVIMNPKTAQVPDDPATLYAICGALAYRANENNGGRVIQYAERLPTEFSVLLVADAVRKCPNLQNVPEFVQWSINHAEVIV